MLLSGPFATDATIRPLAWKRIRYPAARTESLAAHKLLNATTIGTHAPAANPVMERPNIGPFADSLAPKSRAPTPARSNPERMNGFRQPTQSVKIPTGIRTIACHSPYI